MTGMEIIKRNWKLYLVDGALLGCFLISVSIVVPLLQYPGWHGPELIASEFLRRTIIGIAMGLTAITLIYSPAGAYSGALMNPAVTLAFMRIGKIKPVDAVGYILAQFVMGAATVFVMGKIIGSPFTDSPVHYAPTVPGKWGVGVAFATETILAFCLLFLVLKVSNTQHIKRYTGLIAGIFITFSITLFAPLSGFAINPARMVASALSSGVWTGAWIYFLGPIGGMLAAVELYTWLANRKKSTAFPPVICCKLNHEHTYECPHCGSGGCGPHLKIPT